MFRTCHRRQNQHRLFAPCTVLALVMLAGCAGGSRPPIAATAGASNYDIDAITVLLDRGDVKAARKMIKAGRKQNPNDPKLAVLNDSITRDPVSLLGAKHFTYEARPGDTLGSIAERFLGNRLLTYQLARYNGIERPDTLVAGELLRIPGNAPAANVSSDTPAAKRPQSEKKATAPIPSKAPAPRPAAATKYDPKAAQVLRSRGLTALHRGEVGTAINLLQRASSLDPDNAAIKTDLARAQRVAVNVRSRKRRD